MTTTTLEACYTHRLEALERTDPELAEAIAQERRRQDQQVILIASENTVSRAVLEALGSEFTNKYAEGYPGKRYYGGCQFVDVGERLARSRAMMLFGADHANVQPHSGAQANMAVCYALLKPGDTILSMSLDHGGHLSHGHPKNFSGSMYRIVPYGVDRQSERIDYEEVERLARAERPKLIIAGASAYARVIDFPRMAAIAGGAGAELLVDMAHIAGLVAAGVHPSPVPHAGLVTSTTHKTLRGPRGGLILCRESWKKAIDGALFPGIQGGPLMHVIAAKAVAFKEALGDEFRAYQRRIVQNAARLASALAGHGYRIVSGGTDTHLFLVDLRSKDITGKVAEDRLEAAGLTANKNMIPFDPQKPTVTSGLRIGTPTVSSRGMGAGEMDRIATWIDRILTAREGELEAATRAVRAEVAELCRAFPLRS